MTAEGWTPIDNSHLLRGTCTRCGEDTLAAADQTETAMCGPCRHDAVAEKITRGGTLTTSFEAPTVERFRNKSWKRGADGVIRDQWGRYVLPDPATGELRAYTRVSTLKDTFSNSWNIRMWDRRTSVYGVATNPDLAAQALTVQRSENGKFEGPWREVLDQIAKAAFVAGGGEDGADKGTEWHRWRELFDSPMEWAVAENIPEWVGVTLRRREAVMQEHGLRVVSGMSERVVIIPELDAAGTFDELFEQDGDGVLFIGDEKSQQAWYDGGLLEAIQMAAYSRAEWIVDVAKIGNDAAANLAALSPMPAVDQQTAKIIWVPAGKGYAEVKNVDLAEAWGWAQLAVRLRAARKGEWVTTAPRPAAPIALADPAPESGCTAAACRERGRCPGDGKLITMVQQIAEAKGDRDALLWLRDHHTAAGRWAPYFDRQAGLVTEQQVEDAQLAQITEHIREATSRAALERLWNDTKDLNWTPEMVSLAQQRLARLDVLAEREQRAAELSAVARDPRAPEEVADAALEELAVMRPVGHLEADGCVCTVETHPVSGAVMRIIDLEAGCPNMNAMHRIEREGWLSERILAAPDRETLERLWSDHSEHWTEDLSTMARTRTRLMTLSGAAAARAAMGPVPDMADVHEPAWSDQAEEFCRDEAHAWNCEKPHTLDNPTLRDMIEEQLRLCRTPEAMTEIWNANAPAGQWDDGLTELGMTVLRTSQTV